MDVRPPDLLTPVDPWPPERPDGAYKVVLAWGPFTVIPSGGRPRVGWLLTEVSTQGEVYLQWNDGDRVHSMADRGWMAVGESMVSGDPGAGVVRPVASSDLPPDWQQLPMPVALARLRRDFGIEQAQDWYAAGRAL